MLSKRLLESAKYLKGFNYLADCGTDHAYLPIYAVKHGYVTHAIASDNKQLPLNNAKKNIDSENLDIKTVLADGLPYLNSEIDIVSILGMGGRLIKDIISKADLYHVKRLVLSPNSEAIILRRYLENNNFKIKHEEVIKDKNKFYQIIVCEPGIMKLTEVELEFGPIIIKDNTKTFKEYINKLIDKLTVATKQVKDSKNLEILMNRISILKEIIS
ncbi:MAG: SAM-dependent methyltransferase [Tenericutes bacterium]|nr:SAM-dependent methyltransferase [Mycoplasmatota bacterium]